MLNSTSQDSRSRRPTLAHRVFISLKDVLHVVAQEARRPTLFLSAPDVCPTSPLPGDLSDGDSTSTLTSTFHDLVDVFMLSSPLLLPTVLSTRALPPLEHLEGGDEVGEPDFSASVLPQEATLRTSPVEPAVSSAAFYSTIDPHQINAADHLRPIPPRFFSSSSLSAEAAAAATLVPPTVTAVAKAYIHAAPRPLSQAFFAAGSDLFLFRPKRLPDSVPPFAEGAAKVMNERSVGVAPPPPPPPRFYCTPSRGRGTTTRGSIRGSLTSSFSCTSVLGVTLLSSRRCCCRSCSWTSPRRGACAPTTTTTTPTLLCTEFSSRHSTKRSYETHTR